MSNELNEAERALTLLIVTHLSSMRDGCVEIPCDDITQYVCQFIKGKLVIPTAEQQAALDKDANDDPTFDPQLILDYEQTVNDKFLELEQHCVQFVLNTVKAKLLE